MDLGPLPQSNGGDSDGDELLAAANDEDDEEVDEELAEHGSIIPQQLNDPRDEAEAQAAISRRVYVDGLVARRDLNGGGATIIQWRTDAQRWEIEMDRRDELVLVRSLHLRFLDLPAPIVRKPQKALHRASGSEEGAQRQAGGKSAKKRKRK